MAGRRSSCGFIGAHPSTGEIELASRSQSALRRIIGINIAKCGRRLNKKCGR
jgi:hypothetical protein